MFERLRSHPSTAHSVDVSYTAPRKTRVQAAWGYVKSYWLVYLLAGPGLLALMLFTYLPLLGSVIAFEDYSPVTLFASPWVGLRNFGMLTTSAIFGRLVFNTLFLNILFITAETIMGLALALLLNELRVKFFKRVSQSLMFLPYFIGWPVVGVMLLSFIDYDMGIFNNILSSLGLEKIAFTNTPGIWPWLLTVIRIWKNAGAQCIIYLASLSSIDPQLYEAAAIDGASRFQRMRRISLPLLVGIIILMVLLSIGRIFYADFGLFYIVTRDTPGLYPTTDVIDTFVYRALRQLGDVGMAAAAGFAQSVIGFVLVLVSNLVVRKIDPDKALF